MRFCCHCFFRCLAIHPIIRKFIFFCTFQNPAMPWSKFVAIYAKHVVKTFPFSIEGGVDAGDKTGVENSWNVTAICWNRCIRSWAKLGEILSGSHRRYKNWTTGEICCLSGVLREERWWRVGREGKGWRSWRFCKKILQRFIGYCSNGKRWTFMNAEVQNS